jgi:hypothetical protein
MSDDLKPLRETIDAIDDKILELLNERARVVLAVGEAKKDSSAPFYVPSRETPSTSACAPRAVVLSPRMEYAGCFAK